MADKGNFDPEKAKEALKAAESMLKTQKALLEQSEALNDIWDKVSQNIFGISGADWFSEVPKTTEEIMQQQKMLDKMQSSLKAGADQLNKIAKEAPLSKGITDFAIKFKNTTKEMSGSIIKALGPAFDNLSEDLKTSLELGASPKQLQGLISHLQEHNEELGLSEDKLKEIEEIRKNFIDGEDDYYKKAKKFLENQENKNDTAIEQLEMIGDIQDERVRNQLLQAVQEGELSKFLDEHGQKYNDILQKAGLISDESVEILEANKSLGEEYAKVQDEITKSTKKVLDLGKATEKITNNLFRSFIKATIDFDDAIHKFQTDTGIAIDQNANKMTLLNARSAEFGMSMEDNLGLMQGLSEELQTTNFDVLANAASDFASIRKATGASLETISSIGGELMRMGESSEQVKEFISGANVQAKMFGVSSKKVLSDIERNLKKMRQMGFTGGEESLARMAAQANRLRMNVDEIFDVAKRARTIEGAMEMAAELQLAAGSFSNINPMDLLAAARKGPEELQKILTQMGSDVGHFNEETGKYEFDPVDVDRLQMVADATGMSLDSLQNMIAKQAEDNKKLELFPESMFQIGGRKVEDVRAFVSDLTELDKSEIELMAKDANIDINTDDLSQLNSDQVDALMKIREKEAADLEQQAKENQSFREAQKAFQESITNLLTIMQPVIERLTVFIQWFTKTINELPDGLKSVLAWGLAGLAAFGASLFLGLKLFGANFLTGIQGLFKGGVKGMAKGLMGKASEAGGGAIDKTVGGGMEKVSKGTDGMDAKKGGGVKGFLTGFAQGIQEFGKIKWSELLKFAAALGIVGASIIGFSVAMAKWGGEASIKQMVSAGASLVLLGGSIVLLSKVSKGIDMGNLLKASLAMALVGTSFVPFALAMQMFSEVSWQDVLSALGMMALAIGALIGIGALMSAGPIAAFFIAGAVAVAALGATLLLFSLSLKAAASGFQAFSDVDWSSLSGAGPALLSLVPGLLGFSVAALALANPMTMLGLMMATASLSALSSVMIPLSEAFTSGSEGVSKFNDELERLEEIASNLDVSKLSELKNIASSLSALSMASDIVSAVGNMFEKATGGGGGKTSSSGSAKKEITLNIKMNGREIQKVIIDDTELLS